MKTEIRLAGSGGQGIILASILLAEAASIYDQKNVLQSQVYGAAARGEISKADVIISDSEIYFPEVRSPDILLTLTQDSYDTFIKHIKLTTLIIVDDFYVKTIDKSLNNYVFSITDIALNTTQKRISSNIVALGIISGLTGVVSLDALTETIKNHFKEGVQKNIEALYMGYKIGIGGKNG